MQSKSKIQKTIWTVCSLLIIAALIAGCASKKSSQATSVGKVQKITVTDTVEGSGTIAPSQEASLYWQTTGSVETVKIKEGDQVKKDDVLMTLNPVTVPSSVLAAQEDLASARKNLEDIYTNADTSKVTALQSIITYSGNVRDAQYNLAYYLVPDEQKGMDPMAAMDLMKKRLDAAWTAFEPYMYANETDSTRKDLADKLSAAQSDYDTAVKRVSYLYTLEVAQANLDKARADYEKLSKGPDQNDIDAAKARLAAAEASANQMQITAPFDGEVLVVNYQPGDDVVSSSSTATVAAVLANRTNLQVDVQVDETQIAPVKVGNKAEITVEALPDTKFTGKVTNINPVGTTTSGVVNYSVRVQFDKADPKVLLGGTANVTIQTSEPQSLLAVSISAVQSDTKGEYVYLVAADGSTKRVTVTSGQIVGQNVVVASPGLKEGDQVQVSSSSKTSTGGNQRGGGGLFGP